MIPGPKLCLEVQQENSTPPFRAMALLDACGGDPRRARTASAKEMILAIMAGDEEEFRYWMEVRECFESSSQLSAFSSQ